MKFIKIKSILRLLTLVLVITLALSSISNVRAERIDRADIEDGWASGKTSTATSGGIDIDTSELKDIYGKQDETYNKVGGRIISAATYLCYAAAVIVLIVKGVQFMQKAPEAKAEAKKELVSYAVGAIILFGIGSIIKIIGDIAMKSLF